MTELAAGPELLNVNSTSPLDAVTSPLSWPSAIAQSAGEKIEEVYFPNGGVCSRNGTPLRALPATRGRCI